MGEKKCELQHHLNVLTKKSLDFDLKMDFELPILV
jgi:hypothetical protein